MHLFGNLVCILNKLQKKDDFLDKYEVKKLIDIVTELHQKPEDIIDFLKNCGVKVPNKPVHLLLNTLKFEEDIYIELIKKYDPDKWLKIEAQKKRDAEIQHKEEEEKRRKEELEKLAKKINELEGDSKHQAETAEKESPLTDVVVESRSSTDETLITVSDPPSELTDTILESEEFKADTIQEEFVTQDATNDVETTHIPLPKPPSFTVVSTGTVQIQKPKEKPTKTETKQRTRQEPKDKPKEKQVDPKSQPSKPAESVEVVASAKGETEKKWKRKKLSTAEQEEIVRAKSKGLKERLAPTATPEIIKSKRAKPKKVDAQAVQATLRQTMASISEGTKRFKKKQKKVVRADGVEIETNVLRLTEFVTTGELASFLEISPAELIMKCFSMGTIITQNQRLDKDLIVLLASEFKFEVEFIVEEDDEEIEAIDVTKLLPRQPVVTVMGHVDHGKTTLLDFLRKTNVAAGEFGGITQHIGAYEVDIKGKKITFLDTPGHKAFTAMRARGAQITDIVILVVAADDQVMPQTLEAIDHAKAADVPIIIAINKVDKQNAQPEVIKRQLSEHNILLEEWGGKYQSAEISAKHGLNIDKLLEEVLLAAEIADLKAIYEGNAKGVVLEARIEKGRGTVATVLIQQGVIKVGDIFVAGQQFGRVRTILNERDEKRTEAVPGQPIQIVGFGGIPQAGDKFLVYDSEREAKETAQRRQQHQREQTFRTVKRITLEQFSKQREEGIEQADLNIVLKGDADGSVEVLSDSLMKLSGKEVSVNVIHRSVGPITESDVLLAVASHAIIIGFHVHPNVSARELAEKENIDIRLYKTIYQVEEDVRKAIEGMLKPQLKEVIRATIEVRDVFKISKIGTIAGCFVQNGHIIRSHHVRLIRDGREVWNGTINNLQRFKDSVKEVKEGFECGISLSGFNDIKVGDRIESYEIVAEARQFAEQIK